MNITIDISPVVYGRGVSRYTTNLTKTLAEGSDVELSVFGVSLRQTQKLRKIAQLLGVDSKHQHLFPFPPRGLQYLWQHVHFPPLEFAQIETDVFHAWEESVPPTVKTPVIATIHDMAILKFPETAHPQTLARHQASWDALKKRHSHIIAVSKNTKQDFIELVDYPPDLVHVIYEALPFESQKKIEKKDEDNVKQKYHLDAPFLLTVGSREPRKNIERLVKAWQKLKNVDLVVVGAFEWGNESDIDWKQKGLHLLGRVNDKDLAALYASAEVFVFPSIYEGFGLPVLESFFQGTPVVCGSAGALEEVAGNAATYFDPFSIDSMSRIIEKVLEESKEDRRKREQAMKLRLQLFSWEKTAERTVKVYEQAMG